MRERGQHAHERGLAGAVGTENGEDHAARHVEVYAIDGAQCAEALGEAARVDGEWCRPVGGHKRDWRLRIRGKFRRSAKFREAS
jgi:hypothetical protein